MWEAVVQLVVGAVIFLSGCLYATYLHWKYDRDRRGQ